MLAYFRSGPGPAPDLDALGERMARSLGLFAGHAGALATRESSLFSQLSRGSAIRPRGLARLPLTIGRSGAAALFNGEIDNHGELARSLDCPTRDPARLYLAAFERWGDACDLRIVGDYCALIETADGAATRIARSPWRGPPLVFSHDAQRTTVASVPRVLFAAGLDPELDRDQLIAQLLLDNGGSQGWYKGTCRLEIGQRAWLHRDGRMQIEAYYDHCAPRRTRFPKRADYVEAADSLLREGVAAALAGARKPGTLLSGGLDSANVAVRALDCLPPGQTLPAFTFRPHPDCPEPDAASAYFADDWPAVERLGAMHPRLAIHGLRCLDYDQDWERLFAATGVAPFALQNMTIYQPALAAARETGCDVLLDAEFGNQTFSCDGRWGFTEYLLRGRWLQLHRAVQALPPPRRPLPWLWHGLLPLLPARAWLAWQRYNGRDGRPTNLRLANLRGDAPGLDAALARAVANGVSAGRSSLPSRSAWLRDCFGRGSGEAGEIAQGFEQIYGLRLRDPAAYRPLVEFCLGLPTDLFLHDGTDRWLGRELGHGLLPDDQRLNRRYGYHSADWHQRITPRLPQLRAALRAARADPLLGELLDFASIEQDLADWPAQGALDPDTVFRFALAPGRAALIARFSAYVSGRNTGVPD